MTKFGTHMRIDLGMVPTKQNCTNTVLHNIYNTGYRYTHMMYFRTSIYEQRKAHMHSSLHATIFLVVYHLKRKRNLSHSSQVFSSFVVYNE